MSFLHSWVGSYGLTFENDLLNFLNGFSGLQDLKNIISFPIRSMGKNHHTSLALCSTWQVLCNILLHLSNTSNI